MVSCGLCGVGVVIMVDMLSHMQVLAYPCTHPRRGHGVMVASVHETMAEVWVWLVCGRFSGAASPNQTRTRTIVTAPQYGGMACPALTDALNCNENILCRVDCVVSEWTAYSACSAACR